jgi:hypothetical protein
MLGVALGARNNRSRLPSAAVAESSAGFSEEFVDPLITAAIALA